MLALNNTLCNIKLNLKSRYYIQNADIKHNKYPHFVILIRILLCMFAKVKHLHM